MSLRGCWGKECTGTRCQEQARPTRPVCGDGGAGGLSDVGRQGSSKAPQQDHVGRPWLEGMDAPSQHAGEQAPGPTGCRQMMTSPSQPRSPPKTPAPPTSQRTPRSCPWPDTSVLRCIRGPKVTLPEPPH